MDGWPRDREHLGQGADGILAGVVHAARLVLLLVGQLGRLAAQFALDAGDRHPSRVRVAISMSREIYPRELAGAIAKPPFTGMA